MRRALPWAGALAAGIVAAVSIGIAFISASVQGSAQESLDGARELFAARVAVAQAEKELGSADIDAAITSAREANRRAEEVGEITAEIVAYLRPTGKRARAITASARRGAGDVAFTRRHAIAANDLIGAVAGYQTAAADLADRTNTALKRILNALRETNRSFPDLQP